MDHGVWTFVRGNDTLEITREELDDGTTLVISGDGTPRSYFFRESHRLETFQRDMETLLLKTGWTFKAIRARPPHRWRPPRLAAPFERSPPLVDRRRREAPEERRATRRRERGARPRATRAAFP